MRGLLSFTILWLLTKRGMYGGEIGEELHKLRGSKPNPGTLYPALKSLTEAGLVFSVEQGRKKVYELTPQGKEGIESAVEVFYNMYGPIIEDYHRRKLWQPSRVP
jgi:DNA-binding PadR family transcriptional regulator